MPRKRIFVVAHPDGWAVKRPNASRASFVTQTKDEAEKKASQIAEKEGAEVVIQGKSGKFIDSESHGKDPCPPKDKR